MFKFFALVIALVAADALGNELQSPLSAFNTLYQQRLSQVYSCGAEDVYRVCSKQLRNDSVAPFVLHHGRKTAKTAVLFHGLSDSPYYFRPFAEHLHGLGMNVVVALLPAHGLADEQLAKERMLDYTLSEQWRDHVAAVMQLANQFGDTTLIGGFSTGGALAVNYTLHNPDKVDGIMLFSGAMAIADNAESLSRIWGVSRLARWLDRHYAAIGDNPYKYSKVPNSGGLELMEVIVDIRQTLEQGAVVTQPLFVAHSEADITTPIEGVESLLLHTSNQNTVFFIDEKHAVCHADLVLNTVAARKIKLNKNTINPRDACAIPKANPVFNKIADLLSLYVAGI